MSNFSLDPVFTGMTKNIFCHPVLTAAVMCRLGTKPFSNPHLQAFFFEDDIFWFNNDFFFA